MGKGGGAGKVYFVLYLAVVLELLIIIVERDEAEELLHKKQKDTMRIVESILSQLQSGSGTEGINTRPKDEITIPPPDQELGVDIKPNRQYTVEVGVTDVSKEVASLMRERERSTEKPIDSELASRIKKLILLSNVAEIQYQVFYCESDGDDEANMPAFVADEILETYDSASTGGFRGMETKTPIIDEDTEKTWFFMGMRELKLDNEATYASIEPKIRNATLTYEDIIPVYSDSTLQYGDPCVTEDTARTKNFYFTVENVDSSDMRVSAGEEVKKRSFVVNFQPPDNKGGWYKLRFTSRTNRILGIQRDPNSLDVRLDDDETVNIGTVELTVKDLRKVYKELKKKVDGYGLPSLEDINRDQADGGKTIAELDEAIVKAKYRDDIDGQKRGNIDLYGYIVKLLSVNKSKFFAQNQGDMVIDIRVIEPEMPPSEPGIKIPDLTYCFDKTKPVFDFVALNYEKNKSRLTMVVEDEAGNRASTVRWEYMEGQEPTTGKPMTVRMVGYVDDKLAPGKYKLVAYHKKSGREKIEETAMEIFPSNLTEDSKIDIEQRFGFTLFYGSKTFFDAKPSSQGKIKPNQFKIYVQTDDMEEPKVYQGLSLKREIAMVYEPPTKAVDFKIVWVQPITEDEIVLYETANSLSVKMTEPRIVDVAKEVEFSGQTRKIRGLVTGIRVTSPPTGADKAAIITPLDNISYESDVPGYSFSSEPYIQGNPEDGYEIDFEISGKPPTGSRKAEGTITITISFRAQHPDFPSISSTATKTIRIPVSYEATRRRR